MVAREEIRALAEPLVASAGLELWDVEVSPGIVRFLVDRPASTESGSPGGVDLDELSALSRPLSRLLDEHPDVEPLGRYQLEVSSPGLERPLRTPEQFLRYLGSEVSVKTVQPVDGARRLRGTLVAADEDRVRLDCSEISKTVELRYDQIARARTAMLIEPRPSRGDGAP